MWTRFWSLALRWRSKRERLPFLRDNGFSFRILHVAWPLIPSAAAPVSATAWVEASRTEFFSFHRSRFIYSQRATSNFVTVKARNCFFRRSVVRHLDKSKSLGSPGISVCNDSRRLNSTMLFKHVCQICFRCLIREISNVNLLCHSLTSVH